MKRIINYLLEYYATLNKKRFLICSVFIGLAIYYNYQFGLNEAIAGYHGAGKYFRWYLVFLIVFGFGYLVTDKRLFNNRKFILLLLLAPAIFSWKMVYLPNFSFSSDLAKNEYWNNIAYWPVKILGVSLSLLVLHFFLDRDKPFYGMGFKEFNAGPYLLMLLIMVPLIAAASTQQDFLSMYPKFQKLAFLYQENTGWYKLLYELSYGSDFFTIELFFRGFLVLAFARYAGKGAVLPMALFYCTIHFGKPLGECISSYFGGLILGVVVYHTRNIFGGLMVHVGIAWLMELGGYVGQTFLS